MHETGKKPRSTAPRWMIFGGSIALAAIVAGALTYVILARKSKQKELDPQQYRRMVSAFYGGVAAMDVDNNELAQTRLGQAAQIDSDEPAAWADLGLLHLRAGDMESAGRKLEKAHLLAPQNGPIEMLLGLLETRRGNFANAVEHFRTAARLDPDNLRVHYAIAGAAERQGGAEGEAEQQRQLDEMLKLRPNNLSILLDEIRAAARRNDAKTTRELVDRVAGLSAGWTPESKEQLKELQKAIADPDVRQAATRVAYLRNVLMREAAFRNDIAAVQTSLERVGEPIEHFLTLPTPSPTPAAADAALAFTTTLAGTGEIADAGAVVAAWLDRDSPPVLFAANGKELRRVDGKGIAMAFPGGTSGAAPSADGVLSVDWMNDFHSGFVLAGAGGVRLFRQSDAGAFTDVTRKAISDQTVIDGDYYGAWAADIDLDGDLDIVLAPRHGAPVVLRNNSDGAFKVIHPFEGISGLRSFRWIDLDGDGAPDAAVLDESGKVSIYINERSAKFRLRPLPGNIGRVAAIAIGDVNRDGRFDLVALTEAGRILRISDKGEGADFEIVTLAQLPELSQRDAAEARLVVADVDHNGAVDLIVSTPGGSDILLGTPDGSFEHLTTKQEARILAATAVGADGQLALIGLSRQGAAVQIIPHGSKNYGWETLKPRAKQLTGDGRINSFGLGGEMELRAGLLLQKMPIESGAVNFGLGDNPQADAVRIIWPNGSNQGEFDLKPGRTVVAEQRLKGSCPMLFTFDGTGMQFVTDLIWRSPLGLRINAQDTAAAMQTEDWVKVRGDQLVPRDGYYDLRVTAELWETHYFDHLSLTAVDHPAGTEVFVDERFAIPQPPLKIFVTDLPQPVMRATDDRGNDVTALVRTRDGAYAGDFSRGSYQGIASDHWLEIELGPETPVNKPLVLLGTGWIHPTDSSINVAISQGDHPAPRGLSIEIPTADGGWKTAREGLGFPAGKNKTIVLPLDGLWEPGSRRRLRLRTNLEIYWDVISVAALLDDASLRKQRLAPQQAELGYRGFSTITQADKRSPELPDYAKLSGTLPRWPDLTGYYTRFGDVRELLEKVDDRYVIMNAGDELRLRFPALPAPEIGWSRDFIVMADGWEKDGDYNTAFSGTVLPLPRHDWPSYDKAPGRLEDDPAYRRHPQDWLNYHTRYVTPRAYRDVLKPSNGREN